MIQAIAGAFLACIFYTKLDRMNDKLTEIVNLLRRERK